jgi:hypothetical protein
MMGFGSCVGFPISLHALNRPPGSCLPDAWDFARLRLLTHLQILGGGALLQDRCAPICRTLSQSRHSLPRLALRSVRSGFTLLQCTEHKRERDEGSADYPTMVEPKRVNPRPLWIESRVSDRNSIAGRKSNNRLLRRIDDAVHATIRIGKFEYRIDLSGVRAVEPNHNSLYVGCVGGRALVPAVDQHAAEHEDHRNREQ